MNVQAALASQYHGALAMLKGAIEICPDDLWNGGFYPVPFWRVAYHTLYFTHLYLQPDMKRFRPWEHHRDQYHDLPWPPDSEPKIDDPYTKSQILDYWRLCDAMIEDSLGRLDLNANVSGIPWHKSMPKLDHQMHNIRHIQHHAALLFGRLRPALGPGAEFRWVRGERAKP